MFTKKLEDQFSADLLNTVRGVLGEAKHDKECECEKCEKEEEDDEDEDEKEKMKEGYVSHAQRKAVWANRADDGAGHPDKKKKMKKEEVELEEADAPKPPFDGPYRKVGEKRKDQYGNEIKNVAKHLAKKAMSAQKNEEVELEEGEGAYRRYNQMRKRKTNEYLGMVKKHQDAGHDLQTAKNKASQEFDALEAKRRKNARPLPQTRDLMKKEEVEQIDELSKKTLGSYVNKAAERIGTQGVTAGLKIAADEKSSKNFKNMGKRQKGIATAVSKLTKEEQDFIDSLNDADVEQIDELSGATLGSYMVKSKKDETARRERGIKVRDEIRKQTGMNVGTPIDRKLYSPTASRGAGQKTAMKKLTGQARVNAKEEFELEEGRGRPPKVGSAAWKARQQKADDDMVALGMQLRKAQSINKKVRFMDGKEHDIHPNHINRFNDHMGARRTTQEKDNFQKQAHKSHADFVKAVSAPVPKAAKDTGEIVKYRH